MMVGIVAFGHLETPLGFVQITLILLGFFLLGAWVNRYLRPSFSYRYAYGIVVMLFMVFAGYVLAQSRYDVVRLNHFSRYQEEQGMLRIRLIDPVEEKANSYQLVGRVTHIIGPDKVMKARGKIMIWLEKEEQVPKLQYGDIILTENYYQQTRGVINPHAFDYRHFLSRQNIFHTTWRRSGEWHFTGRNEGNSIVAAAHRMRQKALHTLETNNIRGKDFAVASALLLGYREYLDEDLQREFSGAGAMHILCVSGLHVGIIFVVLNLLMGPLARTRLGRFLKTFFLLLLIWFYAAITGFSPSVMRASTMISFVAIGLTFSRNTNIYNTLAGSALLLILMDPFIIYRLGFQLSYLAVVSIVWLQPLLYKQLYFKNRIANGAWSIATVSLAAQLGTAPLTLYYFHQFPNYFIFTNLLVIPLTGIIIKGGILLFITSPLAILSQYVGVLLSWMVWLMHSYVRLIEGLPGSVSYNIVIGFHDKLIIFFIILATGMWWESKQKRWVYPLLAGLLGLSISFTARSLSHKNRQQLVVYHVPDATAIDIISKGRLYTYASDQLKQEPMLTSLNIRDNRLWSGLASTEPVYLHAQKEFHCPDLFQKGNFIHVNGHTIKIIDREEVLAQECCFPDSIQHIIVRDNVWCRVEDILKAYPTRMIIFDSSNSVSRSRRWMEQCDSLGVDCWSVTLSGAYVWDY